MRIFYSIIFLVVVQNVAGDGIQIKVEQGWLEGEILDLVTGDGQYYSFKGIPYALPPNGTWRFKAPQPPLSWTGVRNAKKHGSVCPQFDILANKFIPGNEDCLFLNVYSPNMTPEKPYSVIVFIHGGSYKYGSGDVDNYGPDFFVSKDIVFVTINYRLDALGFLSLGTEEVPGNAGLKDQVAALKWVQRNIKYFGGDENQVTIMGQSAGSASVGLHIVSPMSQGLFHRAIAMSGSPFCDWSLAFHPERRAFVLGKTLGFETEDSEELLEFLQSVPSDKLVATSPNIMALEEYAYNIIKMYYFVPVVEKSNGGDNFLTDNIFEKFGYTNEVDIMFGNTNQEVVVVVEYLIGLLENYNKYPETLVPRKTLNKLGPNSILELSDKIRKYYFGNKTIDVNSLKEFVNYANDITFLHDNRRYFINLPFAENKLRYYYNFSIYGSRNMYGSQGEKYGISGSAHMDDLFYFFDPKLMNMTLNKNSTEFQIINKVTTFFADFAKYGNPTHTSESESGIKWPLFDKETMQCLNIENDNITVTSLVDDATYNFWEEFYCAARSYI
ncbi:hypothetical protein PYW07_016197 [Mythimna separata]|uniref:Carboxylic ester hydrolase n=1 Tax=Mythimna separata TaxID=271217 RepID=A0AAD7YQP2_MYTSE|nr:hypothetical protein PYW07_016197 [Mythimna separata]